MHWVVGCMRGVVDMMCGSLTRRNLCLLYMCVCFLVNNVGDAGATALAETWKRCPELRDVNLGRKWRCAMCLKL